MAELGVLFILDAVLQSDERVGTLESRLHFECIELVHVVDLLGIFISSDDKARAFLVVDGVSHASHLYRDLVSPAILDLNEHTSHNDQARCLVDHAVGLVHHKQPVSTHFAGEISLH